MIYELRVYKCVPGRLPALLNRFANITLKLWEKHGIKQAGFWTTLVGESNQELYYLLAWESLADREKKWNAFAADPEWHAKRAETEKDGAIVANVSNQFLAPTAFSSVKLNLTPRSGPQGASRRVGPSDDVAHPSRRALRALLSDCVTGQAICHGFLSRRMALRMVRSL